MGKHKKNCPECHGNGWISTQSGMMKCKCNLTFEEQEMLHSIDPGKNTMPVKDYWFYK